MTPYRNTTDEAIVIPLAPSVTVEAGDVGDLTEHQERDPRVRVLIGTGKLVPVT